VLRAEGVYGFVRLDWERVEMISDPRIGPTVVHDLPPAQPPDAPSIRPPFNLQSMAVQICKIQQFLRRQREGK